MPRPADLREWAGPLRPRARRPQLKRDPLGGIGPRISMLFFGSLLVAVGSFLVLAFTVVRLVLSRRAAATTPETDPPHVTWSSPIVVIPLALMTLCAALLLAFFAFWAACVGEC